MKIADVYECTMRIFGLDVLYAVVTSNVTRRLKTINATWVPHARHVRIYSNQASEFDDRVIAIAPNAITRRETIRFRYDLALQHATRIAVQQGIPWVMMVDDDTFVIPHNVDRLLNSVNRSTVFLGQQCPSFGGFRSFCGGAGWIARTSLCERLVLSLPTCRRAFKRETEHDRLVGRCLFQHMQVTPTWVNELNSQPPVFYETFAGLKDRPDGYAKAATFHYVKTFVASNRAHYFALWKTLHLVDDRGSKNIL